MYLKVACTETHKLNYIYHSGGIPWFRRKLRYQPCFKFLSQSDYARTHLGRDMCLPTMWHPGKCRPRRALAAPLQAKKPQMTLSQQLNTHRLFKRPSNAPTRPRVCAGRSEPLLVSHTTLWKPHVATHMWIVYQPFTWNIQLYHLCKESTSIALSI